MIEVVNNTAAQKQLSSETDCKVKATLLILQLENSSTTPNKMKLPLIVLKGGLLVENLQTW